MRAALAFALLVFFAATAQAQPFDQAQVDAGMLLYKPGFANCEVCHGWRGGGAFLHEEPWTISVAVGPPIEQTKRSRAQLIELVACGTVTAELRKPHYLAEAWTDAYPCGGKVAKDMPPHQLPPVAPRPLTMAQIESVVTYVQATYLNGGMTLAQCVKYFGEKSKGCDIFR